MRRNTESTQRLAGTAVIAALVMLLQLVVNIPIGPFSITLTLVPIIIGAIIYGTASGAFLGGVFGAVVSYQVVTGAAGALSTLMFEERPVITIALCMLKGILAGGASGIIYKCFRKKLGVILASIACPIVNTGIFVASLLAIYYSITNQFIIDSGLSADYASVSNFVITAVVGLNFLVEFAVNVLLIPIILRIISIIKPQENF